jgi:glycosyltransferase involved in cell wall biosynthesis
MPKISLITPCFNVAPFIGEALASVAAQTVTDWEHVIVDDGSTDDSGAIVEAVSARDARVKLLRQTNRGVCAARNAGFRACSPSSQYLLFLDADDYLEPQMLEVLCGHLDVHPEAGIAYCDYSRIDESGRPLPAEPPIPRYVPSALGMRQLPPSEPRTPLESIVCGAPVLESLSVLRRSAYEQTPGWPESFGQHGEGTELFTRMALVSEVHFVPRPLYRYRKRAGQSTSDELKKARQSARLRERLGKMPGITPAQQQQIRAALRFVHYRAGPLDGVMAGLRHARRGELRRAARFIMGAAWRYPISLWPVPRV